MDGVGVDGVAVDRLLVDTVAEIRTLALLLRGGPLDLLGAFRRAGTVGAGTVRAGSSGVPAHLGPTIVATDVPGATTTRSARHVAGL